MILEIEAQPDFNQVLSEHFDAIAKEQACSMLQPMIERASKEYLLVDRKMAAKLLCIAPSTFDAVRKLPQIELIEHRIPNTSKIVFDPNELKKAMLSILE